MHDKSDVMWMTNGQNKIPIPIPIMTRLTIIGAVPPLMKGIGTVYFHGYSYYILH
jgi:hypothetical protein